MTPDPKYLVMKNAVGGTRIFLDRAAIIGSKAPAFKYQPMQLGDMVGIAESHIPNMEPNPITKIDDIRTPSLPSYSFPLPHVTVAIGSVTDVAADMAVGVAMIWDCAICHYAPLTRLPSNHLLLGYYVAANAARFENS